MDWNREEAQLLERAVARDPGFVAAQCLLAQVYLNLYWKNEDHTDRRLAMAKSAIDQAARQQPDAGEVHLAKAYFYYHGSRDYVSALTEAGLASATLPNDGSVLALIAYVERRRGHWEESTAHLEEALSLDPRDALVAGGLLENYSALRRYADAERIAKEILSWEPNALTAAWLLADVEIDWKADTRDVRAAVSSDSTQAADVPELARARLWLALLERHYLSARNALTAYDQPNIESGKGSQWPLERYEGVIARGLGEAGKAQAAFARARDRASAIVRQRPDDAKAIAVLARIEADLGHKEVALREAQRAVDLLPINRDAFDGPDMLENLAGIYATAGERDHALDLLKTLATTPGGIDYGSLKLDLVWDPLRGDPRFEKIVASLAPK